MNEDDIKKISYLDLYEILDISKDNFDIKKLKKNYKKLILRIHPDKTNKDSEAFELVNLAYSILKNDNLKTIYNYNRKLYLQNSTFIDLKKNNNNGKNLGRKKRGIRERGERREERGAGLRYRG